MENIGAVCAKMVQRRKMMGISQGELAVKLGISRRSVQRIESGSFTENELINTLKALNIVMYIIEQEIADNIHPI